MGAEKTGILRGLHQTFKRRAAFGARKRALKSRIPASGSVIIAGL